MNCLIVGTGGVGGSLAAFLALAGHRVTCIARGKHKEQMLSCGLRFHSDIKGEVTIPCRPYSEEPLKNTSAEQPLISVCSSDEYTGTAQLILVCVKGYSINDVATCITKAAGKDTIVLPILNVYGTGPRIAKICPEVKVIDGCIYIVSFVNAPGEITQMGQVCKLIFGARPYDNVPIEELKKISEALQQAGIKAILSDDINRDTFVKWGFISAMACTGAYFNVPMGALQQEGPERELFTNLTRESAALGHKLGISFRQDPIEANLRIIDALAPDSTASMQKDIALGHESEIQGQLFDLLEACETNGVEAPTYRLVADKFRKKL